MQLVFFLLMAAPRTWILWNALCHVRCTAQLPPLLIPLFFLSLNPLTSFFSFSIISLTSHPFLVCVCLLECVCGGLLFYLTRAGVYVCVVDQQTCRRGHADRWVEGQEGKVHTLQITSNTRVTSKPALTVFAPVCVEPPQILMQFCEVTAGIAFKELWSEGNVQIGLLCVLVSLCWVLSLQTLRCQAFLEIFFLLPDFPRVPGAQVTWVTPDLVFQTYSKLNTDIMTLHHPHFFSGFL